MKFYIGNTDYNWYSYLSKINPEDINFWQPGGKTRFGVLNTGLPFLLRLKYPHDAIAGIGFFSSHTFLPLSVAWDTFGNRNGSEDYDTLWKLITNYRRGAWEANPVIGCIVLTNPIFFSKEDWIATPGNWAKSIVQGKTYDTGESYGAAIWANVQRLLDKYLYLPANEAGKSQLLLEPSASAAYGKEVLSKVRLGQGAFRVLITDAYHRKCSITGEKTLPVLEAAHIKPYAISGPHFISNGLLLRSDIHKLFDSGYITITSDYTIEVSKRIREEFENGKEYYQYHGKSLINIPGREPDRPDKKYTDWHNLNVFKG